MILLCSVLAFQLAAPAAPAAPADVAVVIGRRSGVSKSQAQQVARTLMQALRAAKYSVAEETVDGTKCGGKKPCLVALGRQTEHELLVVLEVGNVLDDGLVLAEAISVDEDGKRTGFVEYQGNLDDAAALTKSFSTLTASMRGRAAEVVPPPVTAPTPTPTPAPPAQVLAPTPPPPAPPPLVTTAEAPQGSSGVSGRTVAGVVLLALGGGAAIGSGLFGGQALTAAKKVDMLCPVRSECASDDAHAAYREAQQSQTLGIGLAAGAGVSAAVGAVLLLTGGASSASSPAVSVTITPSFAGVSTAFNW